MSEQSEHPAGGTPPPGERTSPSPPETGHGDVIGTAPHASAPERPPSRYRRWPANAGVRMGAVAIVAGLVGGLVGGGVVAAFSGDDHERVQPVRFERGMPRGGPAFRGPRYWVPRGQWSRPCPGPPQTPGPPVVPSPRTTG